jgi:hypothetical protein
MIKECPDNSDMFINLGKVHVMARVKLNGRNLGGVWMAPFILNAGDALKTGENKLEIEVVNVWRNRLIRDKFLPENQKYTFILVDDIQCGEPLQPSGLIGPVTIEAIER